MRVLRSGRVRNGAETVSELPIEIVGFQEQKWTRKQKVIEKDTVSAGATETITAGIPAGALVTGLTAIVLKALAGASLTTWSLGVTSDTDRYGTGLAKDLGTRVNSLISSASDARAPINYVADMNILMTAAAGVFSSGKVRITVHYEELSAEIR